MMLCSEIAEELAPLKHANIYEIAINRPPELLTSPRRRSRIKRTVIRRVPNEMHAQNASAAKACATIHSELT